MASVGDEAGALTDAEAGAAESYHTAPDADVDDVESDGADANQAAEPEPSKPTPAVPTARPPWYTRRQFWYIGLAGAVVIVGVALAVVLGVNPNESAEASDSSSLPEAASKEDVAADRAAIATLSPSAAPSGVASGAPSWLRSDAPSPGASGAPTDSPTGATASLALTNLSEAILSALGGNDTDANVTESSPTAQAILSNPGVNDTANNATETAQTPAVVSAANTSATQPGGNDTSVNSTQPPPASTTAIATQPSGNDTAVNSTRPQPASTTTIATQPSGNDTGINDTQPLSASGHSTNIVTTQPSGNDASINATQPLSASGQSTNIVTTIQPTKEPTGSPTNGPSITRTTVAPTTRPSLRPTQSPTATVQTASPSSPPTNVVLPFNVTSWLEALASVSLGEGDPPELTEHAVSGDGQGNDGVTQGATTGATQPTPMPSRPPTARQTTCFTIGTYDAIDRDIERLASDITNIAQRSHFLGGIVRLAAHDFMDFDRRDAQNPMGPDGCFDAAHSGNSGLPEDIWCADCTLTQLHEEKYSQISRADFWIAAANAVTRQTSVNNALDLRDTFVWGRRDADSCAGQGERLPTPGGCADVQDVFLTKMGLSWTDAAALMGAHSLGRGDRQFSGHHGTWSSDNQQSLVFDKRYYGEMYLNSWRPRNLPEAAGGDFTTGQPSGHPRVMLNTDLCLVFDIDGGQCCTHGMFNGQDGCLNSPAASRRCPMLSQSSSRFEARQAVGTMLGGPYPNDNNEPFYNNYRAAWRRATTVGQQNLSPLVQSCV